MTDSLDAHAKPPAKIRQIYKDFQKLNLSSSINCPQLTCFDDSAIREAGGKNLREGSALPTELREVFLEFLKADGIGADYSSQRLVVDSKSYEIPNIPGKTDGSLPSVLSFIILNEVGLLIYPALFPPSVQLALLNRLMHRDLSNPQHQTNVHMHYDVLYPPCGNSYFSRFAGDLSFQPKDPKVHKAISVQQYLNKKLRWQTLGGQYDWTNKLYPASPPPAFPSDVKQLVEGIFSMRAEAAIVNLYSPGDTLSLHRDVSEECNRPLASISLGCDGIFICGLETSDGADAKVATIRLRSGDAVLMSGESRYAWHGIPKVLSGTCPEWMQDWPGEQFGEWRGWMRSKRVNLNVRQMFA